MFANCVVFLWFLFSAPAVMAAPDLMVACYAPIPLSVDATKVCSARKNRVLHAHQGQPSGRRRLMECGEFCEGWDDRTFCTEYMCDADTVGEVCDTIPATGDRKKPILGLVDKAKAHFLDHAKDDKECLGIMEKLVCVCLDQNLME